MDKVETLLSSVANTSKPVRITLAYTDAPGSTAGNAYVNNLDVQVYVNNTLYRGNVFTGGLSSTGGVADIRNNVESVFLPAGTNGNITVRVLGTNIAGDGVPNSGTATDQDFALLVSNVNAASYAQPLTTTVGPALVTESCGSGLIPDPNEQLTISLPLQNIGNINFTNLVATLQATGGIVSPSAAQSYGALAANTTDTKNFSFFVNSSTTCGSTITLTWNLTDGATNYGTVTRQFAVGSAGVTSTQNFDGVTAPALPSGYVQNQTSGTGITWITSTTTPNSTPNCAFANDPATVNATALETPTFAVTLPNATVAFSKAYTTENTFDGVVFEIKIGAGAWTDILAAGGSFASGGYTSTLSSAYSNPIGGRQAWTGTSATYTTTVVNLPASANGQNVQVRWVMGSDNSTASTGFRLDNISINATATCTPCSTLPLTLLSFTGTPQNGFNQLQWNTSNEVHTQLFELEYSLDGTSFTKVYSINANGGSSNNYNQRDNGTWINNNVVYYRLKMIDRNGQFTYSNVITIRQANASSLLTTLYPNPTKNLATLTTNNDKLIGTYIQLTDAKGSMVDRIRIVQLNTIVHLEKFAKGTYILQLANGETLKVIKE